MKAGAAGSLGRCQLQSTAPSYYSREHPNASLAAQKPLLFSQECYFPPVNRRLRGPPWHLSQVSALPDLCLISFCLTRLPGIPCYCISFRRSRVCVLRHPAGSSAPTPPYLYHPLPQDLAGPSAGLRLQLTARRPPYLATISLDLVNGPEFQF